VADSGKEVACPSDCQIVCLAVFLPAFFMVGAAKDCSFLYLWLSGSQWYIILLAGTLVNVLAIWLLKAYLIPRL